MALLDMTDTFAGWLPQTVHFLDELEHHNDREWFTEHRCDYEEFWLQPAREFVMAIGEQLPDIHAEPRIHGSILTINRDVRFSADKRPYKTHLDLWFWQGDGPSRERPGYFVRLTSASLTLGAGMHHFSETALERYRAAVLSEGMGARLVHIADELTGAQLGGQTYKRVPAGLPADHPRADWLRHSGLFAQTDQALPRELFTPEAVGFCLARFKKYRPLLQWLVDLLPG